MQWMSEKLRHSGARLGSTSRSKEMQDKHKGPAKLLEPRKQHSCRPGKGRGLGCLQAASPRAAPPLRPVLPCRAAGPFVTRAIDGKAGAVAQVMSRSESLVLLWADKGRGGQYLCQVTNNPPGSRRCHRHRSWERHKRRRCERRCRCRGARSGCRWGSWVLIGKRQNRA